jgi:hypothetical protein
MVCTPFLYAVTPNALIMKYSSATPTTLTTPFSLHKADYIKSNTRSKPSSRAQQRSACAPKRIPSCSLSRCAASVISLVRSLTPSLALERRAGVVSAKNVPYRRPHRHRDRRPNIRCASPQVRTAHFSHNLFLTFRCSNFMRQQAMGSKMVFNRPVPVNRLVSAIADSASCPASQFLRRS